MKVTRLLVSLMSIALCALSTHAANKYWDIDGATPGAGGATPSGTWSTSAANWSTDSTGSSATAAWSGTTDTAIFSAGTDATGAFTVTVPSTVTAAGLTIQEGAVSKADGGAAIALGTSALTINAGASFSINGSAALTASSGSTCSLNGSTIENRTTGSAGSFLPVGMTITVGASGGILSYPTAGVLNILQTGTPGNVISGTGGITKTGAGILAVATACTYSGSTTINDGILRCRTSSNRLPTGTAVIINSPGVFDPGVSTSTYQQVGSIEGNGDITFGASGNLIINQTSGTKTFSGVIGDGAFGGRITKKGAGTLELSGANSYSGRWTNLAGTTTVTSSGTFCDPIADLYMEGGTLNLNNAAQTIENLSSAPANTGGIINLGTGHVLTSVPVNSTAYYGKLTGAGAFEYGGGSYTLTLTADNTYNGGTTLSSGTLLLTGNNTGTGPITITSGTLKITGSVTTPAATTINGGRLWGVSGGSLASSAISVAASATNKVQVVTAGGTFTAGAMTFASSSVLEFDYGYTIAPSATPALTVNGAVDFTANPTISLIAFGLPPGTGTYKLMTWSGATTGSFTDQSVSTTPLITATVHQNGNSLELIVSQNSEPLAWATGDGTWDVGTYNWKNSLGVSAAYAEVNGVGDQVLFEDTYSGPGPKITVGLSGTYTPANVTADNSNKEYVLAGPGGISGPTQLTKKGSNRLTLTSTSHGYTGGTFVQGGTLALGDGATDGMVSGDLSIDTGTSLVVSNVSDQTLGNVTGAGTFTKGSAGTLTLTAGTANNMSGGQNVYDGILTFASSANLMSGPILVDGPNAKVVMPFSSYIGATVAGSGNVTLDNGATLQNDENTAVANSFLTANRNINIGAGGGILYLSGSTPAILGYQGSINGYPTSGTGTVTKDGPGELRVYNAHNSFGKLVIKGGWYTAGHGTGSTYNDSYGVAPAVTTPDSITILNGSIMRLAGAAPGVTLDSKQGITMGTGGGIIRVVAGLTLAIPGPITGGGALQLNSAADSGIITLGGANDCTGGMTLIKGTLNINNATALGATASTFTINPWLTNSITIDNTSGAAVTLVNNNPQVWYTNFTFTGANDLNLGAGAVSLNNSMTITTTTAGKALTVGGGITEAGSGLSFTKAGAGILRLTAANAYSGGTTVSAGTLDIQKDGGLGSGNVTVASGATLKLSAGTANTYIASGATLTLNGASPSVNLAFTGTPNTISALYFGATQMPAGTWGAPGSGATYQSSFFTGTGKLLVSTGSAVVATQPSTILSITNPVSGSAILTIQGTAAASYSLVASPDVAAPLATWTNVPGTITNAPHPSGQWKATVTSPDSQYYRVKGN